MVSEHVIMAYTGHKKSDTLKKYIRQTNERKDNMEARLGKGMFRMTVSLNRHKANFDPLI
jgi:hypothetical protein